MTKILFSSYGNTQTSKCICYDNKEKKMCLTTGTEVSKLFFLIYIDMI